MAGEGEVHDLKAHEKSYSLFTGVMKWGAIICFIAAMLVIFIIA